MTKNYYGHYDANFSDLLGKTITHIAMPLGEEQGIIQCDDDTEYSLTYYPDCCASAVIDEIHGDLNDLIGEPLLEAEEVQSGDNPPDFVPGKYEQDSFTWTFYKLGTRKGSVTIRWYGKSNGYYSETATFECTK